MPINQNQIDLFVTKFEEREANAGQSTALAAVMAVQDNDLRGLRRVILAEGWPKFYTITAHPDKMLAVLGQSDIKIIDIEQLPGGGPP